jgi:uncharacterized protein YjaZ
MRQAGGLSEAHRAEVAIQVRATFDRAASYVALQPVHIVVDTDLGNVIPEVGIGGFSPSATRVTISIDPMRADLDAVIQRALPPMLAHELHHAARHATVGYGATLLEAAVSEGLADHFSAELYGGPPPPWAIALGGQELAVWTETLLAEPPGAYDHAKWFYGTGGTVPRWTGYAVGYGLVGAFLDLNPSALPSRLVDEPASSFRGG